jgi:hypothetical protein
VKVVHFDNFGFWATLWAIFFLQLIWSPCVRAKKWTLFYSDMKKTTFHREMGGYQGERMTLWKNRPKCSPTHSCQNSPEMYSM